MKRTKEGSLYLEFKRKEEATSVVGEQECADGV
jgi:hypothetical protein